MSRGGKRKGAGRPAGAVTKKTRQTAEKASASGLTPLDYMLSVLRDEDAPKEERMWAAEKAAPYVHAKLASVESKISGALTINQTVDRPPRESREEWMNRRSREMGFDVGAAAGAAN